MGKKRKKDRFIKLPYDLMVSPAQKALSHTAFRVYALLKLKYNGFNESDLSLTYKEMERYMNRRTFSKAMKQLIALGFVDKVHQGGLMKNCNIYALSERWRWYGKK